MKNKKIIFPLIISFIIGIGIYMNNYINEYNKQQALIEEGTPTQIEYVIEELKDGVWVETDRYTVYIVD